MSKQERHIYHPSIGHVCETFADGVDARKQELEDGWELLPNPKRPTDSWNPDTRKWERNRQLEEDLKDMNKF